MSDNNNATPGASQFTANEVNQLAHQVQQMKLNDKQDKTQVLLEEQLLILAGIKDWGPRGEPTLDEQILILAGVKDWKLEGGSTDPASNGAAEEADEADEMAGAGGDAKEKQGRADLAQPKTVQEMDHHLSTLSDWQLAMWAERALDLAKQAQGDQSPKPSV
ncbi:hypothetical protein N0V83_000816 [Neocucurbitaria cava]|uniref:Uncharacterized protein n=1 Tax=Neocucurbitaria cava TaxID=798079 RepID=A0A9W8YHU6_9PLEO|nr:hypothetical protein N0V83_000816 [Neocucurbitaria cava]